MLLCRRKGRKKIFCFRLKIVELEDWEILKVERKSTIGIRLTQVEYNVYSNIFEYRITTDIEAWWLLQASPFFEIDRPNFTNPLHFLQLIFCRRSIINMYIRGVIRKFFWCFRFFSPLVGKHTLMLSLFSDVRAFRALDCKSCDSTLYIDYHFSIISEFADVI